MRSIPQDKIRHLAPKITHKESPKPVPDDALTAAVKAFPAQLAAAIKQLPTPVIAPRPPGAWIIDVKRNTAGQMSQMTAKFHETTK